MDNLADLTKYKNSPDIYITYTDVDKLGINPNPIDKTTPLGIYAYRLIDVFDAAMARNLPFSYRKYIQVFEGSGNILDLSQYTDYEEDLLKLSDLYGKKPFFINEDSLMDFFIRNEQHDHASSIWSVTRVLSRRIAILSHRPQHVVWNSVWRSLGYSGVLDIGAGIIHKLEESQAVFFSKTHCQVVDVLRNG